MEHAHGGSDDGTMMTGGGHMTPWFHFSRLDSLYFSSWYPSSAGALAGAAIGLFFLAVFERWLSATKRGVYQQWNMRALAEQNKAKRTLPPFIITHDLPRGLLYAFHALIGYLIMLAIMTFQASYFIAIVVGAGVGEVLFGRLGPKHM